MIKLKNIMLSTLLTTSLFSNDYYAMLDSVSLESLGKLQVYTASRSSMDYNNAPASITIITADEIKKSGYKNLWDVFDRVPGFYNSAAVGVASLSTRGIVRDSNGGILLLLNGHSLSNYASGPGLLEIYRFPHMNKIQRIEIIHGASSTLWGSEATMAVINVITKSASNIEGSDSAYGALELTYDRDTLLKRNIANIIYAKQFEDAGDLFFSATYSESSPDKINSYSRGKVGDTDYIPYDWQQQIWDFKPNYDIFAKYQIGDFTMQGQYTETVKVDTYRTPVSKPYYKGEAHNYFNWLEAKYISNFSDSLSLESKLYYNSYAAKIPRTDARTPGLTEIVLENSFEGFGTELLLHYEINNETEMKVGVQVSDMDIGIKRYGVVQTEVNDKNYAVYSDFTYRGVDDLQLIAGLRWAANYGAVNKKVLLPSFSAVYNITPNYTAKYIFNTGYVRPGQSQIPGVYTEKKDSTDTATHYEYNIKQDEEDSYTQDIVLMYTKDETRVVATLFYEHYSNFYDHVGNAPGSNPIGTYNGLDVYPRVASIGGVTSYGLELEFKHKLDEQWDIYGNASYSHARVDDRIFGALDSVMATFYVTEDLRLTGAPESIWNLGFNYLATDKLSLNFHYRGWDGVYSKRTTDIPTFERFGPEHFFDMNIVYLASDMIEATIYGKNLLDNTNRVPSKNGYSDQILSLQLGASLTVKF